MFMYLVSDFDLSDKIGMMEDLSDDQKWVLMEFGMDAETALQIMTKDWG